MTVKHCCFDHTIGPFVKPYNIELGDQEFFTQFISIDILWAHRLHIVPPWRKQSIALAFLCGPSLFCSTGSVCHTWQDPVPVQPVGGGGACAYNTVESHKVKRWSRCCLLTRLFRSRLVQEGRRRRRGVGCLPLCCTLKCHGGGSMLSPWKPSLSNI